MSKELEKLKDRADHDEYLFRKDTNKESAVKFLEENNTFFTIANKKEQALEIIKRIGFNEVEYIMYVSYDTYIESRFNPIPRNEFDLLKEVLS